MALVVDTNVILVANGQHAAIGETCRRACARRLREIMREGRVAIDEGYRILKEYQHKTLTRGQRREGDAFVIWLLRNNANKKRCDQVKLVHHVKRTFESFPDDARLKDFDPSDRKFVAVAAAHGESPPILQATDSKWVGWAPALKENGIEVEFLCPDDIKAFHEKKKGRKGKGR